jgi:hypothetical protein
MISNRVFRKLALGKRPSAAVAAAIVWALCLPSAYAQGGFNGPGRYQITNLKSGQVLDLDQRDETSVIQLSSRGTSTQSWDIQRAGPGFYYLRNALNGTVLEASGARNSSPVRATRFSGGTSQQWRFDAGKDGNALIVSRLGRTLDIPGSTSSEGARVQIYDVNGDSNQRFTFQSVSANQGGGSARAPVSSNVGTGRTELKPGWNMFSPQQDVELGQQAAAEVVQQIPMLNDSRVDNYLNTLGRRLSANAPGFKYPYTYKAVNDRAINAFALPGGNIYINRGVIEAADNEAQLAGVMAHETAHVALRHGTNQASKASAAQLPLAILGGLLGSESTGAALAQLGAGFTVNSILLKYSRDAERQADLLGTQMLSDAGYDPRAMGQFFQKLMTQNPGGSGPAFFNSHPSPDRRVEGVNEEVAKLGSRPVSRTGSQEFDQIKRSLQAMPAPRPNQNQALSGGPAPGGSGPSRPEAASQRFLRYENSVLRIDYPDNWQPFGQADAVTITPRGGMVNDGRGNQALAYGVLVNLYEPHADRSGQRLQGPGFGQNPAMETEQATDQLVAAFQQSNRNMRVVRHHENITVDGTRGLSTYLSNDSPIPGGHRETNWLVTLPHSDGLLFLVFTAPERDFQSYEQAFEQMLDSVRVRR